MIDYPSSPPKPSPRLRSLDADISAFERLLQQIESGELKITGTPVHETVKRVEHKLQLAKEWQAQGNRGLPPLLRRKR